MQISRRRFLRHTGTAASAFLLPSGLLAAGRASAIPSAAPALVTIFLRGAADGLGLVVPYGDDRYYDLRPNLQVPAGSELDLDGFYGLHPSLAPLLPLFQNGDLAIIHAVGSPHDTRSHFDAQDFMEKAAPGNKSVVDGWLNRMLVETGSGPSWQGITLGNATSLALAGSAPELAFSTIDGFSLSASEELRAVIAALPGLPGIPGPDPEELARQLGLDPLQSMWLMEIAEQGWISEVPSQATALENASNDAFEALTQIGSVATETNIVYPPGKLAGNLRDAAALVKAEIGVRTISLNAGGWDHHSNGSGQIGTLGAGLAEALAAFHSDLGAAAKHTLTLVMTEFGRTAAQNGSLGSDHGHGSVMLALGGGLQGARVITNGGFPGLGPAELHDGRDLAVTTDFRDVFADLALNFMQLGTDALPRILPGFASAPNSRPGLFG